MEYHWLGDKTEVRINDQVIGSYTKLSMNNYAYKTRLQDGTAPRTEECVYAIMRDYRKSIEGVEEDVK